MGKVSESLKEWRKKQPRGAIMEPATFEKIKKKGMKKGLGEDSATKVAGKAYWGTAKDKFAKWEGKRRQSGGYVGAKEPVLVGEKGAEVFVPKNEGVVLPTSPSTKNTDLGEYKPVSVWEIIKRLRNPKIGGE